MRPLVRVGVEESQWRGPLSPALSRARERGNGRDA